MTLKNICCVALLLGAPVALAEDPPSEAGERNLGMSVVGNHEAPKSLVIVPWKSSELGTKPGVSGLLEDLARPVDKEVFMRELEYYRIRAE
jgi:hypothetical protein